MMNRKLDRIPRAWIERIFEVLECHYKERWRAIIGTGPMRDIHITNWQGALTGVSAAEIEKALTMCGCYPDADIPTAIEFYHYAKGKRYINAKRTNNDDNYYQSRAIGKQYLEKIKAKLKGCST